MMLPFTPPDGEPLDDLLRRALGMQADAEFDAITAAAARLLGCPVALVSLVSHDRLWFKSRVGLQPESVALRHSMCSHTVRRQAPLIVSDASADPVFCDNPFVTGEHGIRFYAGIPLLIELGPDRTRAAVGTFCVVAREPRELDLQERATLEGLAAVARSLIEARVLAATANDRAGEYAAALMERERLHRQLHQAERIANIGSWRLTLADSRVEWSDQIYAIHEIPVGNTNLLEDALSYFPPPDRAIIEESVRRAAATGSPYDVEVDFVTARGNRKRVRAMGEVERQDGDPIALIGVFQDVTEHHQLRQALEQRANTDDLTRIASRGHFNRVLDEQIAGCCAGQSALALVLIDLDHFKEANDRFGHAAGDQVLQRTAEVLQADWLGGSFAGRLGGDEFVLVLTAPQLTDDVPALLGRLLRELTQTVADDTGSVTVTATMGACLLAPGSDSRRRLLERADQALYVAKRGRRGTAAIAGEPGLIGADGQRTLPDIRLVS